MSLVLRLVSALQGAPRREAQCSCVRIVAMWNPSYTGLYGCMAADAPSTHPIVQHNETECPAVEVVLADTLARMHAAKFLLRCDEDDVKHYIADRRLVAFDLRAEGKFAAIGVWVPSMRAFIQGDLSERFWDDSATISAIDYLFPSRAHLRLTEVSHGFCCERPFVHKLIRLKLLSAAPGTGDRVNKAPLLTRASVAAFLTGRRM